MPNARNLNFVLGSIGTTLRELSRTWKEEVPPIETLVVNKNTGLPGKGIDHFLGIARHVELTTKQKKVLVNAALREVFAYPKWNDVLRTLNLQPATPRAPEAVEAARGYDGGGESEAHLRFKQFIALNPSAVGLPPTFGRGVTEFCIPSGDSLDVLFRCGNKWVAVEVKSRISQEQDIVRGLFQCVKYQAVLDAWRGYEGEFAEVRTILALETSLPRSLVGLRNALGVQVAENIHF
jgi:hypothetical protein